MLELAPRESDYVKSKVAARYLLFQNILLRRVGEMTNLGFVDPFYRMTESVAQRRLHLHKDYRIGFADNQINFFVSGPPVTIEHGIPVILKEKRCPVLELLAANLTRRTLGLFGIRRGHTD